MDHISDVLTAIFVTENHKRKSKKLDKETSQPGNTKMNVSNMPNMSNIPNMNIEQMMQMQTQLEGA